MWCSPAGTYNTTTKSHCSRSGSGSLVDSAPELRHHTNSAVVGEEQIRAVVLLQPSARKVLDLHHVRDVDNIEDAIKHITGTQPLLFKYQEQLWVKLDNTAHNYQSADAFQLLLQS